MMKMKLIRKSLFLFVLLSFGGCIAMDEIQKEKEKVQQKIDEIDQYFDQGHIDWLQSFIAPKEKNLKANKKSNANDLEAWARQDLEKTEHKKKLREEQVKLREQMAKLIKQETRLRKQEIKLRKQQEKLRRQQAEREQAESLNKIMKRLEQTLLIAVPICICVPCIYKIYKYYTAKKDDLVDDENDNVEEDLQDAFFVEEHTEH